MSYRLHTDYRALGEYSLETVLLSGLHDSIGLYQQCGEEERLLALQWLAIAGFALVIGGMLYLGIFGERHTGGYVPPHIENGRPVQGGFR